MKTPSFDFIGRSRLWANTSTVLLVLSVAGLLFRGLNLSIDFEGGTSFTVDEVTQDVTVADVTSAVEGAGGTDVRVQVVTGTDGGRGLFVRMTAVELDGPVSDAVTSVLAEVSGSTQISESFVGPTWGDEISRKALEALIVFLVVVIAYISIRLQFRMAVSAVLALAHDIIITLGVYSWFGFTVSQNTVIALLTILGYSLYDTVVVFDRIEENLAYLGRPGARTFAQVVNTSQNEVLWRSINTSITSLLPVGALLVIGAQLLGATTLQDLGLALFIGMFFGAYSSLFVASPFLNWWSTTRDPEVAELAEKYGDEVDADGTGAAAAARRPVTTQYVRGSGGSKRSRRRGR